MMFRIAEMGDGTFKVHQKKEDGSLWEVFNESYPSEDAARDFIDAIIATTKAITIKRIIEVLV